MNILIAEERIKWTEEMTLILVDWYPNTKTKDIAMYLGISEDVCRNKARKMRLHRSVEYMNLHNVKKRKERVVVPKDDGVWAGYNSKRTVDTGTIYQFANGVMRHRAGC